MQLEIIVPQFRNGILPRIHFSGHVTWGNLLKPRDLGGFFFPQEEIYFLNSGRIRRFLVIFYLFLCRAFSVFQVNAALICRSQFLMCTILDCWNLIYETFCVFQYP